MGIPDIAFYIIVVFTTLGLAFLYFKPLLENGWKRARTLLVRFGLSAQSLCELSPKKGYPLPPCLSEFWKQAGVVVGKRRIQKTTTTVPHVVWDYRSVCNFLLVTNQV